MSPPHTIRRQVFELNCRDAAQGKVLLGQVEEMYWERILPALEQVFDEMSAEGEDLVIDRLEMDLGDVSEAEFERDAAGLIGRAVRRALQEAMRRGGAGTQAGAGSEDNAGRLSFDSPSEGKEAAIRRLSSGEGQWEALVSFLETGMLPWWADAVEFRPWEVFLELARLHPQRLAAFLRQSGGVSLGTGGANAITLTAGGPGERDKVATNVISRIAGAGDKRVFPMALELLLASDAKRALALLELVWHRSMAGKGFTQNDHWRVRGGMLAAAMVDGWGPEFMSSWEAATGLGHGWSRLANGFQGVDRSTGRLKPKETESGLATPDDVWELVGEWLAQKRSTGKLREADSEGDAESKVEGAAEPLDRPIRRHGKHSEEGSHPRRDRAVAEPKLPEEIFVPNAGLVLVAAFLPMFFEHLGLLEGAGFRDDAAQQRAVLLLSLLARGLHPVEEPELVMEKLLAGLPIFAAVDMSIPPTEADLEDADALLQSVIMNWSVLGEVSPDQLRGGFLLREGVLQANGQNWRLRVDRKSYDVVLERLPWSISIIAHPWMKGMLFVEW